MNQEIENTVVRIIKEQLDQPGLKLTLETGSKDVDGWDSLRHVMIIAAVEKAFDMKIDFLDLLNIKTVGDICRTVADTKK